VEETGMSKYTKPRVNSIVTVHIERPNLSAGEGTKKYVYEKRRVLKSESYDQPNTFRVEAIRSNLHHVKLHVIQLKYVTELEMIEGTADQIEQDTGIRYIPVKGSKNQEYTVTVKEGTASECTCVGYTYRRQCRHLGEVQKTVDLKGIISDNNSIQKFTTTHKKGSKRGNSSMSTSKSLSWNDRLALIDHYKPSDEQICSVFGLTQEELTVAREMRTNGTFTPSTNLDVASYNKMFTTESVKPIASLDTGITTTSKPSVKKAPKVKTATKTATKTSGVTSTQKPQTATKKVPEPKKRGRKGTKILDAFQAVPETPTPVDAFMQNYEVSLPVLRQASRFDKSGLTGRVRVKKDKDSKTLMIWREEVK
jgi:hypothetical protein